MSFTSFMINRQFKKSDMKRDEGLMTPEDIERIDNMSYGPHRKWHLLDVYRPSGVKGPLPVVINIHGGGWVYGTKETYQYYLMSLAQKGFAVINPSYRLAPRSKFPAQLEDINSVVAWVQTHQEDYGFDLDHVFLVGDSAGGHLTVLYSNLCTNVAYRSLLNIHPSGNFKPKAVVLNCGVYKIGPEEETGRSDVLLKDLLGKKDFKEKLKLIDPLKYITGNFPPAFVMSATGDFLLDHVPAIEDVFQEQGVDHEVKIYGDEVNKPPHVFQCNIKSELARQCNEDQYAFMMTYVKEHQKTV